MVRFHEKRCSSEEEEQLQRLHRKKCKALLLQSIYPPHILLLPPLPRLLYWSRLLPIPGPWLRLLVLLFQYHSGRKENDIVLENNGDSASPVSFPLLLVASRFISEVSLIIMFPRTHTSRSHSQRIPVQTGESHHLPRKVQSQSPTPTPKRRHALKKNLKLFSISILKTHVNTGFNKYFISCTPLHINIDKLFKKLHVLLYFGLEHI